jgi:leucyl aminopeptidase
MDHPSWPPLPTITTQLLASPLPLFEGDALVLGMGDDWSRSPAVIEIDQATGGLLSKLLSMDELSTKPNKVTSLLLPPGLQVRSLVVVGLGEADKLHPGGAFRAAATAAKQVAGSKYRQRIAYGGFAGDARCMQSSVIGSLTGAVGQDIFRKEPSLYPPAAVHWSGIDQASLRRGEILGQSINATRSWINLPPNYMYPETFARAALQLGQELGFSVEVWDEKKLTEEKCEALLAVARGSVKPPRLCILRYAGTDASQPPIALVGKGVTFDSGGYSLKPTEGMLTMKCDMSGAATVLGIMQAAVRLKLSRPIVGLVGLVENLVSGDAFKLGDVLTSRSGKTIEIHNTDAEGRLVLADVLDVARSYQPSQIIDFATLTGACVVALGNDVTGVMSNRESWQNELLSAAQRAGEYAWPLPMYDFFGEQIAGKVADIKNVGEGRWGGAITAAKFLEEFVGDIPWIHLDIAGPAFLDAPKPWADAGGSGTMIRSLIELLEAA